MNEGETIDEILTCFIKITNEISSLRDTIDNAQKVRKFIRALPKAWEAKATTLKEFNDKKPQDP